MSRQRFWVVCPDFVSGPHGSREIAERMKAGIDAAAHCPHVHNVTESATKPVTENSSWEEE